MRELLCICCCLIFVFLGAGGMMVRCEVVLEHGILRGRWFESVEIGVVDGV